MGGGFTEVGKGMEPRGLAVSRSFRLAKLVSPAVAVAKRPLRAAGLQVGRGAHSPGLRPCSDLRNLAQIFPTMKYSYDELAQMIDHSLLHPTMTDADLEQGCRIAARYRVASVCIKPYAVKQAVEWLRDTGVRVGAVIGFPHGNSATESKRYETELACRDGAVEIDMVINLGKALGGDWDFVEQDVKAVCEEAHGRGARVKVIFENDYLTQGGAGLGSDDFKRRLCQICERAGADWVKTSSGYGFVKQANGGYSYQGATEHDLALMRASVSEKVQVKAAGGVRDLDGLIRVRDLGASRCGATATAAMLDEYRRRVAAEEAGQTASVTAAAIGSGGY